MSDISPEGQAEEVLVPPTKPDVGARLRAAREALGMETEAVASSLKLSKRQVEALEAGDWGKLPGNTFIRGFVRNYARILRLDAAELLADLDAPMPTTPQLDLPQSTSAVLPQTGQVQKRDYAAVLAGIVLVSVAVVAYYLVPTDFWLSKPEESPKPAVAEAPAPLFPPASPPEPGAASAPEQSSGAVASAQAEPPSAPAVAGKGLKMKFTQPSWVEIRDRSGQTIFSQLNPAGSEREIEGQPPFIMVVGNAAHVTVSYQGRNIELQPRSKDDVARVTVE
jgi:cytoskeleton protein RodZ